MTWPITPDQGRYVPRFDRFNWRSDASTSPVIIGLAGHKKRSEKRNLLRCRRNAPASKQLGAPWAPRLNDNVHDVMYTTGRRPQPDQKNFRPPKSISQPAY